nr:MAG TPA: hypothetical protein [Caudoviricetes sp.]
MLAHGHPFVVTDQAAENGEVEFLRGYALYCGREIGTHWGLLRGLILERVD